MNSRARARAADRLKGHIFENVPEHAPVVVSSLNSEGQPDERSIACELRGNKLKSGQRRARAHERVYERERKIPLRFNSFLSNVYKRARTRGKQRGKGKASRGIRARAVPCEIPRMVSLVLSACNNEMPLVFSRVSTLLASSTSPSHFNRGGRERVSSLRCDSIPFSLTDGL